MGPRGLAAAAGGLRDDRVELGHLAAQAAADLVAELEDARVADGVEGAVALIGAVDLARRVEASQVVVFEVVGRCAGDLRELGGRRAGDRVTGSIGPIERLSRHTATHFRSLLIAWGGHRRRGRVLRSAVGSGVPVLAETAGSQSVQARELIVRHFGGLASFG